MSSWIDQLIDDERPWVGISEATDILLMRLAGRRRAVESMKPDWVAAETARQPDDFVPPPELIAELQRRLDSDRGCEGDAQRIVEAVLHLPRQERAEIATAVLRSLDDDLPEPVGPEEWERAWGDEIPQRIDDLDRGVVSTIPADQVFADIRARLAEKARGG